MLLSICWSMNVTEMIFSTQLSDVIPSWYPVTEQELPHFKQWSISGAPSSAVVAASSCKSLPSPKIWLYFSFTLFICMSEPNRGTLVLTDVFSGNERDKNPLAFGENQENISDLAPMTRRREWEIYGRYIRSLVHVGNTERYHTWKSIAIPVLVATTRYI